MSDATLRVLVAMSTQILLKLAAGGTATVWIGTSSTYPKQLLAIRRPHPQLFEDPKFFAELQRQAVIASRLDHPNVVRMYEILSSPDGVELVMEYVDGLAFSDLVRAWDDDATEDTVAAALRVAIDICAGLAAVHALAADDGSPLALAHRDVSPQNILVAADGVAKIKDFGLTRNIAFADRSTTDGVLTSEAGYFAPEYICGAPIDHRIDLFALGIVLWEAIAKRRLFKGENEADTLERILRCEAPSLSETISNAELSRDL
ncbi:MAG: serine/threonine-protein kinase, partial [Polyangiaceae bacterium]